jgi:type I restriction enzyme M protein
MDERTQPPFTLLPDYQPPHIPEGHDWSSLLARDGDDLEAHYRRVLERLGREPGTLGVIFRKALNKVQDPAMLRAALEQLEEVALDLNGKVF